MIKQYFICISFFVLLMMAACCKKKFAVKESKILTQVESYINDLATFSADLKSSNTPICVYFDEDTMNNYRTRVAFYYMYPTSCNNFIGFVERYNRSIYFYSKSEKITSKYFTNIDTSLCIDTILRVPRKFEKLLTYSRYYYLDSNKFNLMSPVTIKAAE